MAKRKQKLSPTLKLDCQKLLFDGRYQSALGSAAFLELTASPREIRQQFRQICPGTAGVYAYLDESLQLIYIGMSSRLNRRLQSYFSKRRRRSKERRIARVARWVIWQPAAHTLIAALRERELIEAYEPAFNVQGRPSRITWSYIVQQATPATSFSLQKSIPKSHDGVWGPVPFTRFQRAAVEGLNLHFQLRDCPVQTPMHFSETGTAPAPHFSPCLRSDLKTCLAPCVSRCSQKQYNLAVKQARAFLNGDLAGCVADIEKEMVTASRQLQFERAARLRDRINALARLDFHLRRFHVWSSQATFVYPVDCQISHKKLWLFFFKGTLAKIAPAPLSANEKQHLLNELKILQNRQAGENQTRTLVHSHDFTSAQVTHRWFRLHPDETSLRLTLARAASRCRTRPKASK